MSINSVYERDNFEDNNQISVESNINLLNIARGPKLKAEGNLFFQKDCVSPVSTITRGKNYLMEPVKTNVPEERADSHQNHSTLLINKKYDLNPMRILMLSKKVGRFVFNLRKNVSRMDYTYLNKYQQGVINDWSCYSELKSDNSKKKMGFLNKKG